MLRSISTLPLKRPQPMLRWSRTHVTRSMGWVTRTSSTGSRTASWSPIGSRGGESLSITQTMAALAAEFGVGKAMIWR
jgi:hypothetical protein